MKFFFKLHPSIVGCTSITPLRHFVQPLTSLNPNQSQRMPAHLVAYPVPQHARPISPPQLPPPRLLSPPPPHLLATPRGTHRRPHHTVTAAILLTSSLLLAAGPIILHRAITVAGVRAPVGGESGGGGCRCEPHRA